MSTPSRRNGLMVCPGCGNERTGAAEGADDAGAAGERVVEDAVGDVLSDGDTVSVVRTLEAEGGPPGIRAGTKARGVRLVDGADGHGVDRGVDGFGAVRLEPSVVRKA